MSEDIYGNRSDLLSSDILERAKALPEKAAQFRAEGRPTLIIPQEKFDELAPRLALVGEYEKILPELIAEAERLRSEITTANVQLMAAGETVCAKDARIAELEALNELNHKNMRSWLDTTTDKEFLDKLQSEIGPKDAYIERLKAAFLSAMDDAGLNAQEAREALERIKEGGKDER